ncbi:serine--tRNA ligase-like [Rutidosis leptorrhynchoides]|uniref:serine--tRNA ligase-like n=1 Tax=Rutidosis leptorrhynchoides TaxID=125765 RepID=UPI003A991E5C
MLDLNLFREEKGYDPEVIRKSQRHRFASVECVDKIIHLDKELRLCMFEKEQLQKDFNKINKEVAKLRISGGDASDLIRKTMEIKSSIAKKDAQVREARAALYSILKTIGNLVHDSVPISNDEANNVVDRTCGEIISKTGLRNHVELVQLLRMVDLERGAKVAGNRGYYLTGDGPCLNRALISFGLDFMQQRGYEELTTPSFMGEDIMAKCAQLAQFDEELYKVTGEGDDKYLIATAEQPLAGYHCGEWIHPDLLPIRYTGHSLCYRKEAGSHGRDTLGIFRVHEFDKIEQFCITSPDGNDSWDILEEMIKNAEEFYQMLKLPYRVVSIVSGALNDAASKKYDLEAWFPASQKYRELVSCSNTTDYQSRELEIRYGYKEGTEHTKKYCHLLNSTLTATQRTICCILENYQTEEGVAVPQVLQPYMGGKTFMPFKSPPSLSTSLRTIKKVLRR